MAETAEILKELEEKIKEVSDIAQAMKEFFRDDLDTSENAMHSIDLRSRLVAKSVRGHACVNFLMCMIVDETRNKNSLADGLEPLSISLKRHVVSFEGKSRQEIIDLFKADTEAKKQNASFNMFAPQK